MFPYLRFAQYGFAGLAMSASLCVYAENNLDQAQALWQNAQQSFLKGKPQVCSQQLDLLSDLLIGEIAYDRLYGLCASAAGKHDIALLAFERIMAQQTNNAEIRLERARTYYLLGMLKEAQSEFRYLAANNPPQSAKPFIKEFLERIQADLVPKLRVSTSLRLNLKAGYDTNANSASELQEFLGFVVSENSRSTESPMYGADIQLRHSRPVRNNVLLSISTSLGEKRYPDAEFVDQQLGTVSAGLMHLGKRHIKRFDVFGYAQSVDSSLNSKGAFARISHTYRWKPNFDIGSYYKGGVIRYKDSLQTKNVNQYTLGVTGRYRFASRKAQTLGFDLNIGRDYQIYNDSNYRRDIYNLRLNHSIQWSDQLRSRLVAEYYVYDYKAPFFSQVFPAPRDDDQKSAYAELHWNINDHWSLTPKIGYSDLESSVDIYEFERFYYELNLAHQWKW